VDELSQPLLKTLFDYSPDSGLLTRKTSPCKGVNIGDAVGCKGNHGYLVVAIGKKTYLVHRVIWLWVYGSLPKHELDHANHIKIDNRISNLQEALHRDNGKNQSMPRNNTSGVMGVCWDNGRNKWAAAIMVNGKTIHLGRFDDLAAAAVARKAATRKYGFHENHGEVV